MICANSALRSSGCDEFPNDKSLIGGKTGGGGGGGTPIAEIAVFPVQTKPKKHYTEKIKKFQVFSSVL